MVTHKGCDCKDDLKLLKYDDLKLDWVDKLND